jgi:hypothetical protein
VSQRPTLEEARARLRALGYLDAGVERILFRPVFEGGGAWLWRAWLPAVLLGALGGALASVAAVEAAEGFASFGSAVVVFLHLFLADLLPAAVLAALLSPLADRSRAPGRAATVAGLAAAAIVFALWIGGTLGLEREISTRALLWGIPVAVAALFLAAAVRLAFLARAFASSGRLPGTATRRVFAAAAAAGLLAAVLLFSSRREPQAVPAPQPSPRAVPTLVLAVDGLDLDGPGKPAEVAELLAKGAAGWWPARALTPPELWTDLASGEPARRHGVRALTRVRPAGAGQSLRPPFGTSWYLRRVGPLLRTVASAPVSGADRRRLDFWEVAASAGIPSLAVGWWASAPWPGATVVDNRAVLSRSKNGVDADRVAVQLFEQDFATRKGYGVATLYLPGCDIERENADPGARLAAVAQVRRVLEDAVGRARRGEVVLIVLAADSHPRAAAPLGRMVVFGGGAAEPRIASVQVRAEDVAPSILARSGVPAARDLPGKPVEALFAAGTLETATVPTYGPRIVPAAAAAPESDREYLEKLRSLGYLK